MHASRCFREHPTTRNSAASRVTIPHVHVVRGRAARGPLPRELPRLPPRSGAAAVPHAERVQDQPAGQLHRLPHAAAAPWATSRTPPRPTTASSASAAATDEPRRRPAPGRPRPCRCVPFHPPADAPLGPGDGARSGRRPCWDRWPRGAAISTPVAYSWRRPSTPSRGGRGPRPGRLGGLRGQGRRSLRKLPARKRRSPPSRPGAREGAAPRNGAVPSSVGGPGSQSKRPRPRLLASCHRGRSVGAELSSGDLHPAGQPRRLGGVSHRVRSLAAAGPGEHCGTPQDWVAYLLRVGRIDDARAEFARIRALRPPNLRHAPGVVRRGNALEPRRFWRDQCGNIAGFCIAGALQRIRRSAFPG